MRKTADRIKIELQHAMQDLIAAKKKKVLLTAEPAHEAGSSFSLESPLSVGGVLAGRLVSAAAGVMNGKGKVQAFGRVGTEVYGVPF